MTGVQLEGATVVLTGASSGIGRATAQALCARGANVVLAARDERTLQEVRDECRERGGQALVVPTDVGDDQQVRALADRAIEHFGGFDVWINNAAVMAYGRFTELPIAVFRRVLDTNLFGALHGARVALEHFHEREHGVLVNIDSLYGRITSPDVTPYVVSKFALRGLTRCLRQETAEYDDIHVCAILPEAVDTPIFEHAGNHSGHRLTALAPAVDPDRVVRSILSVIKSPRREKVVGLTGHVAAWGEAVMPRLYEVVVHRLFETVSFRDEAAPISDGNVFEPDVDGNRIDGGWRRQRRWLRRGTALGLTAAVATGLAWAGRARA